MTDTAAQLRSLLRRPGLLVAPGVTDAWVARLAEDTGFELLLTTGAGISNTALAMPDLGLSTMTEVITTTRRICEAVSLPVIADADTGYGNHLNVTRTVRELESAGVAGFFIEDQVSPKRCGHFDGKRVVEVREMVEKIVAAVSARRNPDVVIIARTDAIAPEGFEAALHRARAYVAAGADMIFVEAPRTSEEIAAIPRSLDVPCMINLVEGGLTPLLPPDDLERIGYKIAAHANLALRAGALAVKRALAVLRSERTSLSIIDDLLPWEERQETVGLSAWRELDDSIAAAAAELMDTFDAGA